jgi:hypothetical protein
MQNWMFRLPGRILCEQSPWSQRGWWACSWLCSSPVSPFLVSVSSYFPCRAHAFFPEPLSNYCQGLSRTFSEICTKFYALPLSDPSINRIGPDIRLQKKGFKHQPVYQLREAFSTVCQNMLVLSYAVASRCSTSPGNYGYHPIFF